MSAYNNDPRVQALVGEQWKVTMATGDPVIVRRSVDNACDWGVFNMDGSMLSSGWWARPEYAIAALIGDPR